MMESIAQSLGEGEKGMVMVHNDEITEVTAEMRTYGGANGALPRNRPCRYTEKKKQDATI